MTLRNLYDRHVRNTALGGVARAVVRAAIAVWYRFLPGVRHGLRWSVAALKSGAAKTAAWLRVAANLAWNIQYRARYILRYYGQRMRPALPWLVRSRETSNFTFDLTARNRAHLAGFVAVALNRPIGEIAGYIEELLNDEALKASVIRRVEALGRDAGLDPTAKFGRRLGWYAIVRAMKPKVVIETGVEKGLGSVVLCAALLRNRQEGHHGRYYGTDIDRAAGMLLDEPYREMGEILYGDSIESLEKLDEEVDLFINDSDHSADYEAREYRVIFPKLSARAVLLADNAHVTDELYLFSREVGWKFLFFKEEPAEHWYLGAGIGLSCQ